MEALFNTLEHQISILAAPIALGHTSGSSRHRSCPARAIATGWSFGDQALSVHTAGSHMRRKGRSCCAQRRCYESDIAKSSASDVRAQEETACHVVERKLIRCADTLILPQFAGHPDKRVNIAI